MSTKYTKEIQDARQVVFKDLIETQFYKSCLNCINMSEDKKFCALNNQTPPVEIIVYGCEVHEFDIPF